MEVSRVGQRLGSVVGVMPVPVEVAANAEVGRMVSHVTSTSSTETMRFFNAFIFRSFPKNLCKKADRRVIRSAFFKNWYSVEILGVLCGKGIYLRNHIAIIEE